MDKEVFITKVLQCCDCPESFEWTAKEQQAYKERDYKPPKRCKACRVMKKERMLAHQNKIQREVTYR